MSPPRLTEVNLPGIRPDISVPGYTRSATRVGIVHIGPGAFHRAHQAAYVDALLHLDPRWAISAVSLKSAGVRDALAPQDGLYTLTTLGETRQVRVIGAIRELLVAAADREAAFARLTSPETRMVTLTVTEKGYCLNAQNALDESHPEIVQDWRTPETPVSVMGWLAEALRRRRSQAMPPFAVVSCDNLTNNGPTLRSALVTFAARRDPSLARWIETEVAFPRTMVDSITPATDDDLRQRVAEVTGLNDAWPVQRESFTQWVVEDLPFLREAPWEAVGVTLAADVSVYERAKLRLLNGAHSTLAYVGVLCGHETVREAMLDTDLERFVTVMMREDVAASLAPAGLDLQAYIDAVLARFRSPGVRHLLSQIVWDGSKKLPVRLMGTVADALRAGRSVQRLTVPIAAWMRFVARQAKADVPIVDPDAAQLAALGKACNGEAEHDVGLFAGLQSVISRDLFAHDGFRQALQTAYQELSTPQAAIRRHT
jgi:fructuronate reductase